MTQNSARDSARRSRARLRLVSSRLRWVCRGSGEMGEYCVSSWGANDAVRVSFSIVCRLCSSLSGRWCQRRGQKGKCGSMVVLEAESMPRQLVGSRSYRLSPALTSSTFQSIGDSQPLNPDQRRANVTQDSDPHEAIVQQDRPMYRCTLTWQRSTPSLRHPRGSTYSHTQTSSKIFTLAFPSRKASVVSMNLHKEAAALHEAIRCSTLQVLDR